MANQVVIDISGKWFTNTGSFPFQDPISGHRFEPGIPVKLKLNDWILSQPVIKAQDASYDEPKEPVEVETKEPVEVKAPEPVRSNKK
jgi:hypothetical protein